MASILHLNKRITKGSILMFCQFNFKIKIASQIMCELAKIFDVLHELGLQASSCI